MMLELPKSSRSTVTLIVIGLAMSDSHVSMAR